MWVRRALSAGFTIIELAVVVGIIGLLAAIALPTYLAYAPRAQVSEAISFLAAAQTAFTEHHANSGAWPSSVSDVVQGSGGKYTGSVAVYESATPPGPEAISLMVNMSFLGTAPEIRGATILLTTTDGGASWICRSGGSRPISPDYLPNSCR